MLKHNTYYEFFASMTVPNPDQVGYWIDLGANSKGKVIKVYNSNTKQWVKLTDVTSEDAVSPYIGSNGNWFVDNRDTGIHAGGKNPYIGSNDHWFIYDPVNKIYVDTDIYAKGLSAYEIAINHGFSGTEDDWLQFLRQPALDAAEEAMYAVDLVNKAIIRVDNAVEVANTAVVEAQKAVSSAQLATDKAEAYIRNPMKIVDDFWYAFDFERNTYYNTNIRATGKSFKIMKTYSSVAEMISDYDTVDVEVGEFVWINTGNVEDPDDSKLYLKSETEWQLVGDLSGSKGIQGESAYEIAVLNGFVGTEEEWLAYLRQPSLDAADQALQAKAQVEATEASVKEAEELRVEAENIRVASENNRISAENERISNEDTRKENEANRITAENSRINEEVVRIANESERVSNEAARKTAEQNRISAEESRVTAEEERKANELVRIETEDNRISAEATRVSNENARITAENNRISAEATRDSNETIRKENESARVSAEESRVTAEADRVSAENIRITNENERIAEENIRKSNETSRISNEETRVSNEDARVAAEAIRESQEDTRKSQEDTRQSNESIRQSNESIRENNETTRVSNEEDRVTAESERTTTFNNIIDLLNTAKSNAETATEAANTAATNANEQADRAKQYSDNPPKVGDDGYWYVYSETNGSYVKTEWSASGINIIDKFDTLDNLINTITNPNNGDSYLVDSNLYMWNGTEWINLGSLKGPKGDTGEPGKDGTNGVSPIISNGTWWVYDDNIKDYVDTGVGAGKEAILTKENIEAVFTGTITSHNHDDVYIKDAPSDSKQYVRYNGAWSAIDLSSMDPYDANWVLNNIATEDQINELVDALNNKRRITIDPIDPDVVADGDDNIYIGITSQAENSFISIYINKEDKTITYGYRMLPALDDIEAMKPKSIDHIPTEDDVEFKFLYDNNTVPYTIGSVVYYNNKFYRLYNIVDGKADWRLESNIEEAPSDGKSYIRKNNKWVNIEDEYGVDSVYWVIFDDSTPTTVLETGGDVEVLNRIISKFKRCLAKPQSDGSAAIVYLNEINSNYFEDGTSTSDYKTGYQWMVHFPKYYYKCEQDPINPDRWKLSISDKKISSFKEERECLIGIFEAYNSSSKLYSIPGVESTGSLKISDFFTYAQANGTNWGLMDYRAHKTIANMFACKYGNTDISTFNSSIPCSGGTKAYNSGNSGNTLSLGNSDGLNNGSSNFLGIEDCYSSKWEFVQGINIVADRTWVVYDGGLKVDTDAAGLISAGYTNVRTIGTSYISNGFITKIIHGEYADVMPTAASGGSGTTYYADYYNYNTGNRIFLRSGYSSNGSRCGVFCSNANDPSSNSYTNIGSRLGFYGTINVYDTDAWKSL